MQPTLNAFLPDAVLGKGFSTATVSSNWQKAYMNSYQQQIVQPPTRQIKFHRVNQECFLSEGERIEHPLDKLRINVAHWLQGGKQ